MANLYGTDYNSAFQAATPQNVEPARAGGRVRCLVDSITLVNAQNGDVIHMGGTKIPAGSQVLGWVLDSEDLGTTATLVLQTESATETIALSGGLDCASGAVVYSESERQGNVPQLVSAEADVTLTVANASGGLDGTVKLIVYYTVV